MSRVAWLLAPLTALLLGAGDLRLGIERLRESCNAYSREPDGTEGELCRAYVQGYLDGARRGISRDVEEPEVESFLDRAARVRLGRLRLETLQRSDPPPCVPSPAPLDDIIRDFERELANRSEAEAGTPALILTGVLRRRFPCQD